MQYVGEGVGSCSCFPKSFVSARLPRNLGGEAAEFDRWGPEWRGEEVS
jgi:hypothetical protein